MFGMAMARCRKKKKNIMNRVELYTTTTTTVVLSVVYVWHNHGKVAEKKKAPWTVEGCVLKHVPHAHPPSTHNV